VQNDITTFRLEFVKRRSETTPYLCIVGRGHAIREKWKEMKTLERQMAFSRSISVFALLCLQHAALAVFRDEGSTGHESLNGTGLWDASARQMLNGMPKSNVTREDLTLLFGQDKGNMLHQDRERSKNVQETIKSRPAPVMDRLVKYSTIMVSDGKEGSALTSHDENEAEDLAGGVETTDDNGEGPSLSVLSETVPRDHEFEYSPPYIDRYVKQMFETINDPDCTKGELDFSRSDNDNTSFSVERAAQIWHKCRLLVIRNFVDKRHIQDFRSNVTQFVYDLNSGKANPNGPTTYQDPRYVYEVGHTRWDLLLPKRFVNKEIITNPLLMHLLTDERVLGEQVKLMAHGIVASEPDANPQAFHEDSSYIYGDASLENAGVAGLEFPSSQVTVMIPLLNITERHGPTEFCIGTPALHGLDATEHMDQWASAELKQNFFDRDMAKHEGSEFSVGWCPGK
jgi:hypothetical protein